MAKPKENRDSKNVVLYARVSTDRQAKKDLSIPDQLERMRQFALAKDLVVITEYVEEGKSATDDNRPVLQQMINRISTCEESIHAILVHSFSRAFRNVVDLGLYLRNLRQLGIRLTSVTQDVEDTHIGKFVTLFYGLVDEMNSSENSKHVKRARRENARRGYFNGSKPPYGYQVVDTKVLGHTGYRKILAIDEEEAEIVREIFDLYESNDSNTSTMGMKKIVAHLNSKCRYRGSLWRIQIIHRILSDQVYTGIYLFGERTRIKKE